MIFGQPGERARVQVKRRVKGCRNRWEFSRQGRKTEQGLAWCGCDSGDGGARRLVEFLELFNSFSDCGKEAVDDK